MKINTKMYEIMIQTVAQLQNCWNILQQSGHDGHVQGGWSLVVQQNLSATENEI
jgi:hypothetical protein